MRCPSSSFRRAGLWAGVLCVLLLGRALAAATSADVPASPLTQFKSAWQRVASGQPDEPDSAALKALAIYPYLQAARLQRDLKNVDTDTPSPDGAVAAFLQAHAGEPVSRALTRAWLHSLADRQDWVALLANYDPARSDDSLRCQWFAARIAMDDTTGLAADVARAYQTPRSLPDCDTAFDWLRQQGQLSTAMTVARARNALRAGHASFARQLAAQLPDDQAAPLQRWATLIADPERGVRAAIDDPQQALPGGALADGWFRLARRAPDTAMQLYPRLLQARQLKGGDARIYTRDLALGLAWDRRPQAVHYFRRFTPRRDDDVAQIWRVRAALWAQNWRLAQRWIAAMPATLRDQPAWQYWRARALAETGHVERARAIYQRLAATDGYYPLLAAMQLRQGYTPQVTAVPDHVALRHQLDQMPGVQRAHELFDVQLNSQASTEWLVALAAAAPDARLQGIRLAMHWGWYDQAVATASQQGVFEDYPLLYPRPYDAAVAAAAARSGLAPDWIYGVIRQESLYRADAVSSAHAYGLMQLLLPTARAVARRHDLPPPADADALFDPARNVLLGATHLRELLDWGDGRLTLALAAYNAGRHRADHWLPPAALPADVWIDNIPFDETRLYVQRILWHIAVFGWRRSGAPQDIRALLQPVAPLAADAGGDTP